MKNRILALLLVLSIGASAQVDTVKTIQKINGQGFAYKNIQADSSLSFPKDTFHLKSTWRGVAFKGAAPYYWSGVKWEAFGTGSGSADSAIFATLYRLDTAKTNLRASIASKLAITDTANKWITGLYRRADSVFYEKGGTHIFAYKDSVGAGGGGSFTTDSLKYNSTTSTLTLYQTGASDLSAYVNSSYLLFDSTYQPLGGSVNDSTAKVKSTRLQLNGSTVSPTVTDSTISWNIAALVAADTTNKYVTAVYRKTATDSVFYVKGGTHTFAFKDSIGAGGGSSPAGNFGNIQINRNGSFATPASDSLGFSAGLSIKGSLSATALPTGGVAADSVVVINSSGALKKRNASAFVTTNGATATGQFALFNGAGTVYSSTKFKFSDATYPSMSIIGSDPLIYTGPSTTLANDAAFGYGSGAVIYGGATYKSVQFVDQISGGIQLARFYSGGGTIYNNLNGLVISNTLASPSNYQGSYTIQRTVPYAATGLNYHGFTDQTDFRVGANSFNSFGSFVTIGNNRTTQGHFAAFQSVWYKDSSNRMQAIYDFVSAVSEMRAGTVDSLYRFKVFEATKTGGTIVKQYGIQIDNLTAATTNVGAWIYNNVGIGPNAHTPSERLTIDGNILGTGTIQTGDPGSGAGAWRLGTVQTSSSLAIDTVNYIEISIGGVTYKLALAVPPSPKP